jgi:hypothetical protein
MVGHDTRNVTEMMIMNNELDKVWGGSRISEEIKRNNSDIIQASLSIRLKSNLRCTEFRQLIRLTIYIFIFSANPVTECESSAH